MVIVSDNHHTGTNYLSSHILYILSIVLPIVTYYLLTMSIGAIRGNLGLVHFIKKLICCLFNFEGRGLFLVKQRQHWLSKNMADIYQVGFKPK